ncbi:TonB-dependent receptor domain-containing protein [Aestuariivita boseongensis]|uniref:TonB-dependent receptor domain-containing protein n=1 Tax=Aestuariivita boseongensis TaxID=1470562 RepID=UPI0009E62FEF|nr:TonB-dependent receptor [Aestuariivita boseongensis]
MLKTRIHMVRTGAVCFVLGWTGAAHAQEGDFLGTVLLGESKREVQTDTATSQTIVDQEEISDRQAGTVAELIDSVPGVTLVNGATAAGSGINLRGFGANGTFGTDQKILIQVDGATKGSEELYRIGTQLFTDPFLYREVEVLRGTVGSFSYGSGVVGGVVRLETKDASDFTGGDVGLALNQVLEFSSNGDGITSSSTLAWQPTTDLEFLLNYTRRTLGVQEDGTGTPINPAAGDIDDPSWLFKARYTFGNNREHALSFSLSDTQSDQRDVPYDSFGLTTFGNVDRFIQNRVAALRYSYTPMGNDLIDLDVELTYSDEEITQTPVGFGPPIPFLDADHRYETTTFRIRNTSLFQTGQVDHTPQTGIEFIRRERLDAASAPGGTDNRMAIYAINEMRIGEAWTITPALRFETSDIQGSTAPNNGQFDNSALMGGLSVRYAFPNGWAVFGSAAYTENLPIIDDLGNPVFMQQSEKARTWEFGVSYDALDVFATGDSLAFKAVAYDTLLWDATSFGSMPPGTGVIEVDRQGLELEAAYTLQSGLYVDLNAHISNGNALREDGAVVDWAENPADSLRLTVGRNFGERLNLSWEAVANRRYDEGGAVSPGFVAHNLRATWRPEALQGAEVRFGIENVFDKTFTPRLSTRPAAGRNFKLTLAKSF